MDNIFKIDERVDFFGDKEIELPPMDLQVSALGAVLSVKRREIGHVHTIADPFDLSRQQKTPARGVCAGVFSLSLDLLDHPLPEFCMEITLF